MNSRYRSFAARLLEWYRANRRDLPWRRTRDPYRIWVAEVLLQQTQVKTALPYYERLLARFPTVHALAAARLDDVLKTWEGAGYYARARNLHHAAKQIVKHWRGRLPSRVQDLLSLPGVGEYTAGAVASIAFNREVPALDGNAVRVLSRYLAFSSAADGNVSATRRRLNETAAHMIPRGRARDFNQALMELGATLCTPRSPRCPLCPVRRGCAARRLGQQEQYPARRAARPRPHYEIGIGIVWRNGRILIQQRAPVGLLGGLWEFPGGKREAGESLAACVRRELLEETGLTVRVGRKLAVVEHDYSHLSVTLHAYECEYVAGRVRLRRSARSGGAGAEHFRWVRPAELDRYAFPAANRKIIARLDGQ